MVQNLNGYLMYFLWDEYISSKPQELIMLLISENWKSSLPSRLALYMYLIEYVNKIPR